MFPTKVQTQPTHSTYSYTSVTPGPDSYKRSECPHLEPTHLKYRLPNHQEASVKHLDPTCQKNRYSNPQLENRWTNLEKNPSFDASEPTRRSRTPLCTVQSIPCPISRMIPKFSTLWVLRKPTCIQCNSITVPPPLGHIQPTGMSESNRNKSNRIAFRLDLYKSNRIFHFDLFLLDLNRSKWNRIFQGGQGLLSSTFAEPTKSSSYVTCLSFALSSSLFFLPSTWSTVHSTTRSIVSVRTLMISEIITHYLRFGC